MLPEETLVTALEDQALQELARRDGERPLSWDELAHCALPKGWSVQDVWDMLFSLRRLHATYLPQTYHTLAHRTFYVPTGEYVRAVIDVAARSSQNSPLYHRLRKRESYSVVQEVIYDEVSTALRLDGLELRRNDIGPLMEGFMPARNLAERICTNLANAVALADTFVSHDFDSDVLMALYHVVTQGVSDEELDTALQVDDDYEARVVNLHTPELYDFFNDRSKDPLEPSVVTGIFLRETIQVLRPFPHFNNVMAWLLCRLYSLKHGYPAVALAPTIYATMLWEKGELGEDELRYGATTSDESPSNPRILVMGHDVPAESMRRFTAIQEYRCARYPDEGDITRYLIVNLAILDWALRRLETRLEERMGELAELALLDTTLNYRQNRARLMVEHNPNEPLSIAAHQKAHGVAYATARADLMGLVDRGYFEMRKQGKKNVFVPGRRITNKR